MDVVALVSGGKDSCYATLLALRAGHRVIATANFFTSTELDSWMYQSAATDHVVAFSQAFGVPMFRSPLTPATTPHSEDDFDKDFQSEKSTTESSEAEKEKSLGSTKEGEVQLNEVELLYNLLHRVKTEFPSLKGVVSGAILSNYQRIRIEHVCSRLGLVSVSPLWEREQDGLLQDMIDNDIDAILVKVAALGLNKSHLGQSIKEMQPHLRKLAAQYGINVCGEGGEYESFTLDAPFFRYRIEIEDTAIILHDQSVYAPVSLLDIRKYRLIYKGSDPEPPPPPVIIVSPSDRYSIRDSLVDPPVRPPSICRVPWNFTRVSHFFFAVNSGAEADGHKTFDECTWDALESMSETLHSHGVSPRDIYHVNVYVADMTQFSNFNSIYGQYFRRDPPSRATVELKDIRGIFGKQLFIEIFGLVPSGVASKKALHVQSISQWAPACIGPYSQATTISFRSSDIEPLSFVSLAGQISLDPFSMGIVPNLDAKSQLERAFSHQQAVESAIGFKKSKTFSQTIFTFDIDQISGFDTDCKNRVLIQPSALPRGALSEIQSFIMSADTELEYSTFEHALFTISITHTKSQMCGIVTSSEALSTTNLQEYIDGIESWIESQESFGLLLWKVYFTPQNTCDPDAFVSQVRLQRRIVSVFPVQRIGQSHVLSELWLVHE